MTRPTIFIGYSCTDKVWKDRLVTHLEALQMQDLLDLWDDSRIGAGEDWYPEIQAAMERACVAILLISADFLSSGFILKEEIPPPAPAPGRGGTIRLPHSRQALSVEAGRVAQSHATPPL
jgi:hypothetical protein